MSDAIPIFEAKNKLPLYIHKAENEGPVRLSRRNKDVAVILSVADYDNIISQLKSFKKSNSIVIRAAAFRERNKDFYTDDNFDQFIENTFSNLRPEDNSGISGEENIWDGVLEDSDE